MLALSDDQLQIVMSAASTLAVEKRDIFLHRVRRPGCNCVALVSPMPISMTRSAQRSRD
jgi:hypothetical protein